MPKPRHAEPQDHAQRFDDTSPKQLGDRGDLLSV